MNARTRIAAGLASLLLTATTACSYQGLNSLPLPGVSGRGADAVTYTVAIANVATLEPNSPVLLGDVTIGSVESISVSNWHAVVRVSVRPDAVVPANAVARVGQTSLLGSLHLSLDPPTGQPPEGRLDPGTTLPLTRSSTYPSTERTLASLSTVLNGGGLGQLSDIVAESAAAVSGNQRPLRDLFGRFERISSVLADQRTDIVDTLSELNRLATTLADNDTVLDDALRTIPPAIDVLTRQRPRITEALSRLGGFSDTAAAVINDTGDDLVENLENLAPVIGAVADVGPKLTDVLPYLTTFPFTQGVIDRGLKGDYMNLFVILDLTIPRLKRTLLLGTRFGQPRMPLTPAPGDPWYLNYTWDPLATGIAPPVPQGQTSIPPAPPPLPGDRQPPVVAPQPPAPLPPPPINTGGGG